MAGSEPSVQPQQDTNQEDSNWLWYLLFSILAAGVVGLGEALVAVYFMGAATASLSLVLWIAIPAFIVNFFLFRADIYEFIQSACSTGFFKDSDGNDFTGWKRILLIAALIIAIFAGVSCGIMQLNSILITFGSLFWGLSAVASIAAPPLGLMILAGAVAAFSALANAALLYYSFENFVRKGYQSYEKTIKKIYYGIDADSNEELHWAERIFLGAVLSLGIMCAVAIYVITLGLYQSQADKFFQGVMKLGEKSTQFLTFVCVTASGQLLNGFFYAKNMLDAITLLGLLFKDALIGSAHIATKFFRHVTGNETECDRDSITPPAVVTHAEPGLNSVLAFILASVVFGGLFWCSLKNGFAQGQGAMTEPKSVEWFTSLDLPQWLAEKLSFYIMSFGSTAANSKACYDEIIAFDKKHTGGQINIVMNFFGYGYEPAGSGSESDLRPPPPISASPISDSAFGRR